MFNTYRLSVVTALNAVSEEKVKEMVGILSRVKSQNANVYILGNGGSAATAMHFANDLTKVCGIRAVALPALISTITAYGNDDGWDQMYAHYLRAVLLPQDVVIGISCSGNSPNVVEAVKMAKDIHLPAVKTIIFTGADVNCQLAKLIPNVVVYVPYRDIRVQEDCHMVICHAIIEALE